eukprot:9606004-Alexandrium_andersonii.AAC.1
MDDRGHVALRPDVLVPLLPSAEALADLAAQPHVPRADLGSVIPMPQLPKNNTRALMVDHSRLQGGPPPLQRHEAA